MNDPADGPGARNSPEAVLDGQFPNRENRLYVNHAAISPWPRCTAGAVAAFARENRDDGPAAYADWLRLAEALRERVAGLLNAAGADDIAFTANTTEGIDIVARGLPWQAGDNIVTPADEFPSNHLPWERLEDRGVELRRVDIRAADDAEQALLDRVDARTRLITVSAVQWTDGFRLDLARLGAGCRQLGAALFVDAIQQFGALPIDVRGWGIDFLAAGCHKWQMGPEGLGVFHCSAEARERLDIGRVGWRMYEHPYRFDPEATGIAAGARRFESGSPNTMGQAALHASLGLLEALGPERAADRILDNTGRLFDGLAAIPSVTVASRGEPERRSGIVSFVPGDRRPRAVCGELAKRNIVCAARGEAVRLSPHYYQGPAELDWLLDAIEAVLA